MFFDLLKIFFDLLSTRQSTLEAQKRLLVKQPQAELKKRVCLKKKRVLDNPQVFILTFHLNADCVNVDLHNRQMDRQPRATTIC